MIKLVKYCHYESGNNLIKKCMCSWSHKCNDCLNKLHRVNSEYVELVESSKKHQRANGFLTYSTLYDEEIIKIGTVFERTRYIYIPILLKLVGAD